MLSSQLTVGVVCYSWTNNPGWGLKVELRSCCGSECHTCDPPTLAGIFALWSPAQSCCCRQTKVLLDLCRENLVMTEQTGRRMKVNKGKNGMKKGEGACFPRWSLPCWSDRGWFLHSVAVFRIPFTLCLFIVIIPFCPLWKVETSQAKTNREMPSKSVDVMLWVWQWQDMLRILND